MNLRLIPREEVEQQWLMAAPLLAPAIALVDGETTMDILLSELVRGERQLIIVSDSGEPVTAVVLTMMSYPNKRACRVSFAGGSRMDEWCYSGLDVVENIARELGADEVQISGRRGWIRKFKGQGYTEHSTLIGKKLKG